MTPKSCASDKPLASPFEALIVRLAIWGLMPIRTAYCLIRRLAGRRS